MSSPHFKTWSRILHSSGTAFLPPSLNDCSGPLLLQGLELQCPENLYQESGSIQSLREGIVHCLQLSFSVDPNDLVVAKIRRLKCYQSFSQGFRRVKRVSLDDSLAFPGHPCSYSSQSTSQILGNLVYVPAWLFTYIVSMIMTCSHPCPMVFLSAISGHPTRGLCDLAIYPWNSNWGQLTALTTLVLVL
jgi:hypothetical protein